MKKIILNITPHPKQAEFFTARGRYIAYGGARGGGKSWAMRTKLVLLALSYPGISILLLRRTLGELRENHILPLQKLLFDIATWRDTVKEFAFPNGSRIKLGYCDSESDVLQYQGQSYEVIGLEEATHFTYYQFLCLTECNRISGNMSEAFSPRMYLTCNPGGVGHDWVKRLFVDRIYQGSEKPENYVFIRSRVYDNEYLMKNNPEYIENLMALPEARRKAMLDGDWNSFEGAFFPEFNYDIHVCQSFTIPKDWGRFRALDYGLDMTACLWVAVTPDGVMFVYRELYENNLILSDAAAKVCVSTAPNEHIRYTTASPDLWNRRQDSGKSGFELMSVQGLRGLIPADNRRVAGWRILREYLRLQNNNCRLRIFANCINLIRTLPQLRFDTLNPEDAAGTPHEITHAPEALRYAVMSREPQSKSTASLTSFERSFDYNTVNNYRRTKDDGYRRFIDF
ncbi:MAG: hypothetical protein A2Y17_08085 [Clostridiales bacterium GWF2_38_85]|nr:MAG: hypothetical protein A2Y17_08085 [Clostridiales bacterium GWF2_38_85]